MLAGAANSENFAEGDVIVNEREKQEKLCIVFLAAWRSLSTARGWFRTLKAPSGDAGMIAIPNQEFGKAIYENWNLAVNMIMKPNEQLNRF